MTRVFRLPVPVTALALMIPVLLIAQRQTRMVFVTAVNPSGEPVLDLTATDFDIREGDDKRSISAASLSNGPMRVMMLIDTGTAVDPYLGQLRPALAAFVDAIPAPHEIGVMSMGRLSRARQAPTTERTKLRDQMSKFSLDGGGVAFLDALRETEDRFQRKDGVKWPVYVIFVTDGNESSSTMQNDELNRIMSDLVLRGTTVHTMYMEKSGPTTATQIAKTLAGATGGLIEEVTAVQTFPEKLKKVADRITSDFDVMKTRYQVQYVTDAKYKGPVDMGVTRPGVKGKLHSSRGQ